MKHRSSRRYRRYGEKVLCLAESILKSMDLPTFSEVRSKLINFSCEVTPREQEVAVEDTDNWLQAKSEDLDFKFAHTPHTHLVSNEFRNFPGKSMDPLKFESQTPFFIGHTLTTKWSYWSRTFVTPVNGRTYIWITGVYPPDKSLDPTIVPGIPHVTPGIEQSFWYPCVNREKAVAVILTLTLALAFAVSIHHPNRTHCGHTHTWFTASKLSNSRPSSLLYIF